MPIPHPPSTHPSPSEPNKPNPPPNTKDKSHAKQTMQIPFKHETQTLSKDEAWHDNTASEASATHRAEIMADWARLGVYSTKEWRQDEEGHRFVLCMGGGECLWLGGE